MESNYEQRARALFRYEKVMSTIHQLERSRNNLSVLSLKEVKWTNYGPSRRGS
jgi:hypothetical protein